MEFSKGDLVVYSIPNGYQGDSYLEGKIGEVLQIGGDWGPNTVELDFDGDQVAVCHPSQKLTKIFTT